MEILKQCKVNSVSDWAYVECPPEVKTKLKQILTVRASGKNPFEVKCYKDIAGGLAVPRALFSGIRPQWEGREIDFMFRGILREEQETLVEEFLKRLKQEYGGIIRATTGFGKTVVTLNIISRLRMPALIIVPTEVIMQQWVARCQDFLGITPGIIRQDQCSVADVTIGMLHSLSKEKYPHIVKEFGVVVYDEVHKIPAETFSVTAGMFNCLYRIGLSATPRRKDGTDNVFWWHIGRILASYTAKDIIPTVYMHKYSSVATSEAGCWRRGEFYFSRYLNKLSEDTARNKLIATYILGAYRKNRKTCQLP